MKTGVELDRWWKKLKFRVERFLYFRQRIDLSRLLNLRRVSFSDSTRFDVNWGRFREKFRRRFFRDLYLEINRFDVKFLRNVWSRTLVRIRQSYRSFAKFRGFEKISKIINWLERKWNWLWIVEKRDWSYSLRNCDRENESSDGDSDILGVRNRKIRIIDSEFENNPTRF